MINCAPRSRLVLRNVVAAGLISACLVFQAMAASFSGNSRLEISDSSGGLTWNAGASALTVQCWFKFSIPSGTNLTENMTILVNNRTGSEVSAHAYLIYFNIFTGNVEFSTRGSGLYTNTLITRPYLERWYHVAIVRQGEGFTGYVDGHQVFSGTGPEAVGSSRSTDGVSVGGWGGAKYLYGEVQEVSMYQAAFGPELIVQYMFATQPTNDASLNLKGYFPFGFSANSTNTLRNFAPAPVPTGTDFATQQGAGTVTFEESNQAGEQSAFDAQRNGGRDAIIPLSGAFAWQQTGFGRPTPGIAFDFRFGYSSANSFGGFKLGSISPYDSGPMGGGWRHVFETRVLPAGTFSPLSDTDTVGVMQWDGSIDTWDLDYDTGQYQTRSKEYRGELVITSTNCQWTTPERLVYVFRRPDSGFATAMRGRLSGIRDFNGNAVQAFWSETSGVVTQIVDSVVGKYNFVYDLANRLTNVAFGQWQVNFAYDATNRLISKSLTNSSGIYTNVSTTWQFQYGTNGLLARVIDPRNNTNVFVQYDQYGRKTNTADAIGRATRTEYGVPGKRQIRQTDAAGFQWLDTYDRKGHLLAQSDPLTNTTSYAYDTNGNRVSITEPLGWTTLLGYDSRANVIAKTNALGEVSRWVFHSFFNKAVQEITPKPVDTNGWTTWTNFYAYDAAGNLTNHADAIGSLVSYTYFTNGLVATSTDANENVTRFGYDTNGFLNGRTDPASNTISYVLNDVGWKLKEINPLGDPAAYTYDLNGKNTRIQDVLGRPFYRNYDPNGNVVSSTDGKGQLTTYAFDAANQKTNMVDRTGTNRWNYFYTSRGKQDRVVDPLGNSVASAYDQANRLIRLTDAIGNSTTNQYDANGNVIAFFDKVGQRSTKTLDRLNRIIVETDPLGNTRSTVFDVAGKVLRTLSPNGNATENHYDGRGRLIKWQDAEGFDWFYAYDRVGNITNIIDALNGHYIMAYGPRNERTLERNQDGLEWRYAYDELLRLKQQTDPNLVVRTPTYDAASRVLFVDFSTGRRDSFAYDANDNPQTISRRRAGVTTPLHLLYDPLDRVYEQDDALGLTVRYGYDPLGRVATTTYPGGKTLTNTYDALGRLTSQTDWANRRMTYTYDVADRLTSRTYPNAVTQTNTFDSGGRITGLSCATPTINSNSIDLALTYAYDRNGNKTGSGEKGTFLWPLPSLIQERSRFTPAGRLIDRNIQNNSAVSNQISAVTYAYDPSGNMTNATGSGQTWALNYDEDNHTTAIRWDAGITSKNVTNRYDGLGRRISKTVDGLTTGYALSTVGGMERILCDVDSNGNPIAWYVHGSDLCYRIDASNNVVCFHADAMANIISLSGTNGTSLVQYAYTAYGRSLGSTGFQSQLLNPYLFVGSQGVIEELPGLYFMRARYYSADAGVFLSTDPVKKIGPDWCPSVYSYVDGNPISDLDPKGESIEHYWGNCGGTAVVCRSLSEANGFLDLGFALHDILCLRAEQAPTYAEKVGGAVVANKLLAVWSIAAAFNPMASQDERNHAVVSAIAFGLGPADIWALNYFYPNYAALNSPTAGTTPMAMLKLTQGSFNPSGSSATQIPSFSPTVSSRTVVAAKSATTSQSTKPGGPSLNSGSTGTGGMVGPGTASYITITAGSTLSGLASRYGTTVAQLLALNPSISNPNLIRQGAQLRIR